MQTHLSPELKDDLDAQAAAAILKKCVHCGFCNATCPTYQLLGDELDGPRGRIYLIKQVLEGGEATRSTQQHLDRCLTCLNCETTCPSGVQYGQLLEVGRTLVDQRVRRPLPQKSTRWLLKEGLTSSWFAPALRLAQVLRPLLPKVLKDKVPARVTAHNTQQHNTQQHNTHPEKVLLLRGCVQPAMLPNIDAATVRVLDAAGIAVIQAAGTGCCGALRTHLSDPDGGLRDMRRNIDAWEPLLAGGSIGAIVSSASACALALKSYGHALAGDSRYQARAERISALTRDLSELLPAIAPRLKAKITPRADRLVFHPPCTLQHGQKLRGGVEAQLRALGVDVHPPQGDAHLCCGSAGTYSVLQPKIARELRDRKLAHIQAAVPVCILSANVGCIQHLQSGTQTPVMHWIEWLDQLIH
jgi:glycolate oxidase iron-sulfur subunit